MKDYFMNYYNMIFTQQEFDDLSQKRIKKLRTSSWKNFLLKNLNALIKVNKQYDIKYDNAQ